MSKKNSFGEMSKSLIIAAVLALLFRSLAFEPFNIPSGSMKSTLLVGDYVFVSKYSYGYSRYSFPFGLPLFKGRVLTSQPKRGDVIVFKLPSNPRINYIKRLIGLPGDTIMVQQGVVYLNGKALPRERISDFEDVRRSGGSQKIARFRETLPSGVSYDVLDQTPFGPLDNTALYTVPEGHYFFMGDNRDNSEDSRVLKKVGYVPEDHLLGPARLIFFSTGASLWNPIHWVTKFRTERFLESLSTIKGSKDAPVQ